MAAWHGLEIARFQFDVDESGRQRIDHDGH
jgi:hypothetical protein